MKNLLTLSRLVLFLDLVRHCAHLNVHCGTQHLVNDYGDSYENGGANGILSEFRTLLIDKEFS